MGDRVQPGGGGIPAAGGKRRNASAIDGIPLPLAVEISRRHPMGMGEELAPLVQPLGRRRADGLQHQPAAGVHAADAMAGRAGVVARGDAAGRGPGLEGLADVIGISAEGIGGEKARLCDEGAVEEGAGVMAEDAIGLGRLRRRGPEVPRPTSHRRARAHGARRGRARASAAAGPRRETSRCCRSPRHAAPHRPRQRDMSRPAAGSSAGRPPRSAPSNHRAASGSAEWGRHCPSVVSPGIGGIKEGRSQLMPGA